MGKGKKLVVSVNWDNYDEIYEQLKKNPNIKEVFDYSEYKATGRLYESDVKRYFVEKGWIVFHHSITSWLNDSGIDLIAFKGYKIALIQCKDYHRQSSIKGDVFQTMKKGLDLFLKNILKIGKERRGYIELELILATRYGSVDMETFNKPFLDYPKKFNENGDKPHLSTKIFCFEDDGENLKLKISYQRECNPSKDKTSTINNVVEFCEVIYKLLDEMDFTIGDLCDNSQKNILLEYIYSIKDYLKNKSEELQVETSTNEEYKKILDNIERLFSKVKEKNVKEQK